MALAMESFWHRLRYTRLSDVLCGRVNGSLDWRRVIVEAELPAELDETIAQVVKSSRLWKGERCDVGSELAAHFKDGLEAGVGSEELIKSFGNVKQAARLIRSAKRRNRPLWWQGWWWASRSGAGLLVAYILMIFLLAFDKPVISTDYLEVINRPFVAMPEEERAWPHYLVALEWLKANTEPWQEINSEGNTTVENWLTAPGDGDVVWVDEYLTRTDAQREVVDRWLDERSKFLVLVREAAEYERLGLEVGVYSSRYRELFGMAGEESRVTSGTKMMIEVLLPHVQVMRGSHQVLQADFYRSVHFGDGAAALADLRALIGVARHSGDGPWLVCAYVKCAVFNSAIGSIEKVLAAKPEIWTDQQLVEIAHLLSAAVQLEANGYVVGEKASFYDLVQRLYSDDGNGDGYLTAEGLKKLDREFRPMVEAHGIDLRTSYSEWQYRAAAPASYFLAASRCELIAKNEEWWARMQAEAARPLWDPLPENETLDSELRQISELERYRYTPLLMMLPAYMSATSIFEKAKGRLDGALCGIALELYRREHGVWPDSLEQLSPRLLPRVPVDRINGGELGYRIVDGQPLIYSLGVDGDDDGGVLPVECKGNERDYLVRRPSAKVSEKWDGDWVIWDLRKQLVSRPL